MELLPCQNESIIPSNQTMDSWKKKITDLQIQVALVQKHINKKRPVQSNCLNSHRKKVKLHSLF